MTGIEQPTGLARYLGIELVEAAEGRGVCRLKVMDHHLMSGGAVHAGTIVALADSACGYGCRASLPPAASSFTTVELKTNFLANVATGALVCDARLVHRGRATQVWDAVVRAEGTDGQLALFRCTQLVLYPASRG